MNQALFSVVVFVLLLALVPWAVKWVAKRREGMVGAPSASSKLISVLAVGPQQRVVTVEVGPANAPTWLVLGVTAHAITTLHTLNATTATATAPTSSAAPMVPFVVTPTDVHD
jgi:flagellar protein FliO/FliZ